MSALAEMERELIVERTIAGLIAARAQGRIGGRPVALSVAEQQQAARLLVKGHTRKQLSLIYDVSLSTIYKYLPIEKTRQEQLK